MVIGIIGAGASGMAAALALSACVTSALAAADMVEFNVVNLSFNSKRL